MRNLDDHIVEEALPSPDDRSLCRESSVILLQMFLPRYNLEICGRQNFPSALEAYENRSAPHGSSVRDVTGVFSY
jgi:hypothetical protein